MSRHATGTFEVTSWDEQTYAELEGGGKLTRASVAQAFTGDIDGEGAVEYLMCYREDGTASVVGLQRIDGRVGDRAGSFVVQSTGSFDGREARGSLLVVPGSGTGELRGLRGEGEMVAGATTSIALDYEVE